MRGLVQWKKRYLAVGGTMMMLLSGCQPVGGVDLGKALVNYASVQSYEGSGKLSLQLVPGDTSRLSADDRQKLDLFKNMELNIINTKMQDARNVSVTGEFVYSKGRIPFQLWVSDNQTVVKLEGAPQPIVLNGRPGMPGSNPVPDAYLKMQDQLNAKSKDITTALASFFSKTLPNANTVSVEPASVKVNEESLSTEKIHTELKGTEVLPFAKALLSNILADEIGLKELISQLYDLVLPAIKEAMNSAGPDSSKNEAIQPYLENKTLAVEFAYTTVRNYLSQTLGTLDTSSEQWLSSPEGKEAKSLLTDDMYLKTDLYVDSALSPRKVKTELQIPVNDDGASGIKAVRMVSENDLWNVNGKTTATQIDTENKLEMGEGFKPKLFFNSLNKQSELYKLMVGELHMNREVIKMIMNSNDVSPSYNRPYINLDGVSMVPTRFVSERLDADVKWNGSLQQVTITDQANGTVIVLTVGSNVASVNGKELVMDSSSEFRNSSTFVPGRFIAEQLGAKVEWDNATRMVTITKD